MRSIQKTSLRGVNTAARNAPEKRRCNGHNPVTVIVHRLVLLLPNICVQINLHSPHCFVVRVA